MIDRPFASLLCYPRLNMYERTEEVHMRQNQTIHMNTLEERRDVPLLILQREGEWSGPAAWETGEEHEREDT